MLYGYGILNNHVPTLKATVMGGSSLPLLLDTYSGATVAYSLRKIRRAYAGAAIRVRRSSDDTSQDIGFNSDGTLNTTTLLSFVGSGNGFVSIWYDQSGNDNHANQINSTNQPLIISTGNLQLVNGKPSIYFNESTQPSLVLTTSFTAGNSNFNTYVAKRITTGNKIIGLAGQNSGNNYLFGIWSDNKYYLQAKTTSYQASNNTDLTSNQILLTGMNSSGTMSISKNGSALASAPISLTYTPIINSIGKYTTNEYMMGYLQEIIHYNIDSSSNKIGIESNINTYYSIY